MKYAELKRRLAFVEREINRAKADAYHYERECRRMVESRQDFERHTMREGLAMMQRAVECAPPQPIPICKCMEGEIRERFPAKAPLCAKCKAPMTHKGGIVYSCEDQLCAFGRDPWHG